MTPTPESNQPVILAFFALVTAMSVIVGPIITLIILGRQRRGDVILAAQLKADETKRTEDREDEVAAQVAEVARVAADNQVATASTLATIVKTGADTHALVNSDMTAALTAQLTMARLLVRASKKNKQDPEDRAVIAEAEARIEELEVILHDRHAAQAAIDAHTAEVEAGLADASAVQ